jgi:hypothetical protein
MDIRAHHAPLRPDTTGFLRLTGDPDWSRHQTSGPTDKRPNLMVTVVVTCHRQLACLHVDA